jgi:hypothetical protein
MIFTIKIFKKKIRNREKKSVGTTSPLHAINLEVKNKTVATPYFPSS